VFSLCSVIVKPTAPLVDTTWSGCTVGLHALGPFYERYGTAPDHVLLVELFNNVARHWPEHLAERPRAFAADKWLVELGGEHRTLNVRTFLPHGYLFVDERGRLWASPDGRA
jgi:hypothetical protein